MIDYGAIESVAGRNWYHDDPALVAGVTRSCDPADREWAHGLLDRFGLLTGTTVAAAAEVVDANPPRLQRWDRWANDLDVVVHHPAAIEAKRALWATGYVAGFANEARRRGRPTPGAVMAAAHYLLAQADTGMVCGLGMTSGVADLVDAYAPPDVRTELLAGLRADDLARGIDGSMFLTERDGGSDLGHTVHCTATDIGDGRVLISGEKWFCSNVDGAAIVLLARPDGAPEGPAGLGLYLVPRVVEDGTRNHYSIRRLKQKLGTRSVPTGEVTFDGALGYALRPQREAEPAPGDDGGLARMMEMVNTSRFGVAMMGLGIARRCLSESLVWAHHRTAQGRLLVDLPLAREQLVDRQVEVEAGLALALGCATAARRPDGERLRRILVPALKVRLCRLGVETASFAVELHGGNGYCEDWGLTRQLRDAQCHPIWEGSENICALDVLRASRRDGAHEAVLRLATGASAAAPDLAREAAGVLDGWRYQLATRAGRLLAADRDDAEAGAGRLTDLVVRTASLALLIEQAGADPRAALVAIRYARSHGAAGAAGRDGDRIATRAGRLLLAHDAIDAAMVASATAP